MTLDTELLNGLAGLAALVNSLLLWPVIRGLKRIGATHEERLDDHGERLVSLETRRVRPRRRRR